MQSVTEEETELLADAEVDNEQKPAVTERDSVIFRSFLQIIYRRERGSFLIIFLRRLPADDEQESGRLHEEDTTRFHAEFENLDIKINNRSR